MKLNLGTNNDCTSCQPLACAQLFMAGIVSVVFVLEHSPIDEAKRMRQYCNVTSNYDRAAYTSDASKCPSVIASFPGLYTQLLSLAVRKVGEGLDGLIT